LKSSINWRAAESSVKAWEIGSKYDNLNGSKYEPKPKAHLMGRNYNIINNT